MDVYVFAGIGLFGLLFILISFLMGEIGHVGDLSVHEMGGDAHVGEAGGGHDHAGGVGEHDGPGPLSTRVISIFLAAFGTVATAARLSGLHSVTSAALGLASGYLLGWCTWRFMRLLWVQAASSHIRTLDLEGCPAEVTVAIPASGVGQVACVVHGVRTYQPARSVTGEEAPLGSAVRIAQVTAEGLMVEPVRDGGKTVSEESARRMHHA